MGEIILAHLEGPNVKKKLCKKEDVGGSDSKGNMIMDFVVRVIPLLEGICEARKVGGH